MKKDLDNRISGFAQLQDTVKRAHNIQEECLGANGLINKLNEDKCTLLDKKSMLLVEIQETLKTIDGIKSEMDEKYSTAQDLQKKLIFIDSCNKQLQENYNFEK